MKFSVQVIVHPDDDTEASPVIREVFAFDRDDLAPDTLGLQLAEAKDLLAAVQDTVVEQQVNTAITKQAACPDCGRARRHKDTARSWCAACSARCGWRVPAGGIAAAATSLPGPSSRWPRCCPSGPPRSWPTCRPASPPWSPTASPRTCSASCFPWDGNCMPPWCAARPRPWPSGWKTNSARNGPASSTPASVTARNYPAWTCRSWSGWTAATSTPASSGPAPTAGSR